MFQLSVKVGITCYLQAFQVSVPYGDSAATYVSFKLRRDL